MILIDPVTIGDSQLVASNIVETIPLASSATTYNAWSSSTTYASGNTVCHEFTTDGVPPDGAPSTGTHILVAGDWFAVLTSTINGNLNREPELKVATGSSLPGYIYWNVVLYAAKWSSTTTYGVGVVVGHIHGSTGAFYQSIQADNLNQDPATATTYWRQVVPGTYDEWNSGTTYASGDRIVVFTGQVGSLYTSLQNSNTNNVPASSPAWWEYEGDSYKQWATGTTYAAGDRVLVSSTHHEYESLVGSNLGNDPTTDDGSKWLDLGTTNRRRMFDTSNTRVTTGGETIDVTMQFTDTVDGLALFNMVAQEVQVICTASSVEVYNETFDLSDNGMIDDYRKYFFDPLTFKSDMLITDLPLYSDMLVRVIITNTGGLASCGLCSVGKTYEIGATVYGAAVSYTDYSRYDLNEIGDQFNFVPRGYSKNGRFKVVVAKAAHDSVYNLFVRRRGQFSIFAGTGEYASTWIGGFPREPELIVDYPEQSTLNIELVGIP